MFSENFTFLWNNIYENIMQTINVNNYKELINNFSIIDLNADSITVFTYFSDIYSVFSKETVLKINNIIKNCLNNDNLQINYQENNIDNINLDENKTLNSFILNSENRLALAVANEIIINKDNKLYSPLFLYANSGLGKTHLINGIILKYKENYPNNRILYYSGSSFLDSYFFAVKNNYLNLWRKHNYSCQLFIIDDIDKLENNENAINELNNILDHMYSLKQIPQIIITADKEPDKLRGFSDSIKSRLQWGIKLKIQSPNTLTKEDIIKTIFKRYNLEYNNKIVTYIAENYQSNIREIEGLIKTLFTYSTLLDIKIDENLINKIIGKNTNTQINNKSYSITGNDILYKVCKYFNINEIDIKSKNRTRAIAFPRQIGMYLTKQILNYSLQEIGSIYGGRDHSTVKHSNDKIAELYNNDNNTKNIIDQLYNIINEEQLYYKNQI